MKIPDVPLPLWRDLYEAALRFKHLRPWETLYDSDIFGIRDPETGDTGYACILGALGEVFALCVYRGAEGFEVHRKMQSEELDPERGDLLPMQNCLMAEFTDREYLEKADFQVIKKLGLSFRGSNAWPRFRSYLPGYFPWHLTEPEVRFLTLALDCACDVTKKVASGSLSLNDRSGQHLVYFQKSGTEALKRGSTKCRTRWEVPPVYRPQPPEPFRFGDRNIEAVKSLDLRPDSPWEADCFYLHTPIMDRDRPYLTRVAMVAHHASGYVFHATIVGPEHSLHQVLGQTILDSIRQHHLIPSAIYLRDDALAALLLPLGKALGIPMKSEKRLDSIQTAKRSFENRMRSTESRS